MELDDWYQIPAFLIEIRCVKVIVGVGEHVCVRFRGPIAGQNCQEGVNMIICRYKYE